MSVTVKCDKCEKLLEGIQHCKIEAKHTSLVYGYEEKEYDLCLDCFKGVISFLTVNVVDIKAPLDGRNE